MKPPDGYKPVRFRNQRELIAACKGKIPYQDKDGEMLFRDSSSIPVVYVKEPEIKVNLKYFTPIRY